MTKFALALLLLVSVVAVKAADDPMVALFNTKCAACHGKDGKGAAPMAKMFKVDIALLDLTDKATLDLKDEELNKITTEGLNKMPAYKDKIKAEDIAALTKYFRSLAPKEAAKPKG